MGDRTWLSITVRADDLGKIIAIFGEPEESYPVNTDALNLQYGEVNYGGCGPLEENIKADPSLIFIAHHGSGGGYGPYSLVGHDGIFMEHETGHEQNLTVDVDEATGEICKGQLERARRFLELYRKAEAHLVEATPEAIVRNAMSFLPELIVA